MRSSKLEQHDHADETQRNCEQHDQGIYEAAELSDHNEVDQDRGNHQAARKLVERLPHRTHLAHHAERYALQALSRKPADGERTLLVELLEKHHREFQADPKAAAELTTIGPEKPPRGIDRVELAAWTSVARVILNLSEAITRN